jgi:perosamine synthetase
MDYARQVPVNTPLITESDIDAVSNCLREGWISGDGPIVSKFEAEVAKLADRKYGVAVANGTIAMDLAIELFDLQPGDEVIIPSFTIISCLSQILRKGAIPRFIDSNSETWNMDVDLVEKSISPKTKLIVAPHIYGLPIDMDPLILLAESFGIPLIEDAAESHGLRYKDKVCGSFGALSTYSFYANKHITTGEGGLIVTNDEDLAMRLQSLKNLNFRADERFVSDELGWNYRLGSMQAALGLSQLKRLSEILNQRMEIGAFYQEQLRGVSGIQLPLEKTAYSENNYWVFGLVLNGEMTGKAKEVRAELGSFGIGTRPFFQPLHRQPVLQKFGLSDQMTLPVSEDLGNSGFYIPNGLGTDISDFEYVVDCVVKVLS